MNFLKTIHLKIVIKSQNLVLTEARAEAIKNGCVNLGTALLAGMGPMGRGFFDSFSCKSSDRILFGDDLDSKWVMLVNDNGTKIRMEIVRADQYTEALVEFNSLEMGLAPFQNRDFSELVATSLLDQLPGFARHPYKSRGKYSVSFDDLNKNRVWKLPRIEESLFVYNLGIEDEEGFFSTKIVGELSLSQKNDSKKHKGSLKDKKPSDEWLMSISQFPVKNLPMFIQSKNGRGSQRKKLAKDIAAAVVSLSLGEVSGFDQFFSLVTSSYIGARYGFGLFKDLLLIGNMGFFSLFAEIRGGPVSGLSYYFDIVPEITEKDDAGQKLKLASSRHLLGWSFGHRFDESLIDRIDIRPKIGLWSLSATLPTKEVIENIDEEGNVTTEESDAIFSFNLGAAYSFGIQAGIEKRAGLLLTRLWAGTDFAYGILREVSGSGTVTSISTGADLYFDGPSLSRRLNVSFLLFASYESIALNRVIKELGSSKLKYSQLFAGLGLSVGW